MEETTLLSSVELLALWRELGGSDDTPERYEITEHGEIVMSPRATRRHQIVIALVQTQIVQHLGGLAVPETAVVTKTAGIRVPDVVWMPAARWADGNDVTDAPDLVVEVLSPGNRRAEVAHKVHAYLDSGVREVVVVDLKGEVQFHRAGEPAGDTSVFGLVFDLPKTYFD